MSTFFMDLAKSAGKIVYSSLADVFGLSVRPLALVYAASSSEPPLVRQVLEGGLLHGLVTSISAGLICVSAGVLIRKFFGPAAEVPYLRLLALPYAVDGLAQFPILVSPAARAAWQYPMSRTGLLVTTVQANLLLTFALGLEDWRWSYRSPLRSYKVEGGDDRALVCSWMEVGK